MGDRRAPDAGERVRRWFEVLWPAAVVAAGVLLYQGKQASDLEELAKKLDRLAPVAEEVTKLTLKIEAMQESLVQERRIADLERQAAVGRVSSRVAALEEVVKKHDASLKTIWPRLRAIDKNLAILQRGLERAGQDVTLEKPDRL